MKHFLALVSLLLLPACTGLPTYGLFLPQVDNNTLHAEVFQESYRRISVFYLEPVAFNRLSVAGLRALKDIDPALSADETSARQIRILRNGQPVSTLPAPAAAEWKSWGELTLQGIRAAATVSPVLAAAPPETVYSTVLPAITAQLDGFSHYNPPEDVKADREWDEGYGGIGVTFERKNDAFVVMDVFIDSPAARAGLRAGDRVVAIDGKPLTGMSAQDFSNHVRGTIGSVVTLTVVSRRDTPRQVPITRAHVQPTTVAARRDGKLGIIRISRFMPATLSEFRRAAQQIMWSQPAAIVLDLQHNPGGILESATDIAAMMVPRGQVSRMEGRHPDATEDFTAYGGDVFNGLPLYVLVDGHTASAAEVLAVALQDRNRATIIGSTSFGKGSVQNVGPLPHGGELAVTWARLFGPSGYSYHHQGVHPDLCLSRPGTTPASAATALTSGSERVPLMELQKQAMHDSAAESRLLALCPRSEDVENLALATVRFLIKS